MSWEVGDTVVSEAVFEDADGQPVDPTILSFTFRRPGEQTETKWNYPADPQIVKVPASTGKFYVALPLTVPSNNDEDWIGRWYGSGPKLGRVKRFSVRVGKSAFATAP